MELVATGDRGQTAKAELVEVVPPEEVWEEGDDDALADYLDHHAGTHEDLAEPIPEPLIHYSMIGAGLFVAAAAVFAMLPEPHSIRHDDFFVFGKDLGADMTKTGKGLEGLFFWLGIVLLTGDGLLLALKPRVPLAARYACLGQIPLGALAAAPAAVALAVILGNLVFWLVVITLALMVLARMPSR